MKRARPPSSLAPLLGRPPRSLRADDRDVRAPKRLRTRSADLVEPPHAGWARRPSPDPRDRAHLRTQGRSPRSGPPMGPAHPRVARLVEPERGRAPPTESGNRSSARRDPRIVPRAARGFANGAPTGAFPAIPDHPASPCGPGLLANSGGVADRVQGARRAGGRRGVGVAVQPAGDHERAPGRARRGASASRPAQAREGRARGDCVNFGPGRRAPARLAAGGAVLRAVRDRRGDVPRRSAGFASPCG